MNLGAAPIRSAYHLDAVTGEFCGLSDHLFLEQLVRSVSDVCAMRVLHVTVSNIAEDVSKLGGDVFSDEGGVSVLALISTSHIAMHAWPLRGQFMFDLVSCKVFRAGVVRDLLWGALPISKVVFERAINAMDDSSISLVADSHCAGG